MLFRNYSSRLARALSTTGQVGGLNRLLDRGVEEIFMMRKLPRNLEMHAGSIPK